MSSKISTKQLIIIGAGGLGREVLDLVHAIDTNEKQFEVLGFSDDALPKGFLINGVQILGTLVECLQLYDVHYTIAIGNPSIRLKLYELLIKSNKQLVNLIHPTANISKFATIESNSGVLFFGHSFIGPNTKIGANVLIHNNSVIGHDTVIGAHTIVMQSCVLNGLVTVEDAVIIGAGSVINGKHLLKKNLVLAAGSKLI